MCFEKLIFFVNVLHCFSNVTFQLVVIVSFSFSVTICVSWSLYFLRMFCTVFQMLHFNLLSLLVFLFQLQTCVSRSLYFLRMFCTIFQMLHFNLLSLLIFLFSYNIRLAKHILFANVLHCCSNVTFQLVVVVKCNISTCCCC